MLRSIGSFYNSSGSLERGATRDIHLISLQRYTLFIYHKRNPTIFLSSDAKKAHLRPSETAGSNRMRRKGHHFSIRASPLQGSKASEIFVKGKKFFIKGKNIFVKGKFSEVKAFFSPPLTPSEKGTAHSAPHPVFVLLRPPYGTLKGSDLNHLQNFSPYPLG